mgnify:CR=1 FL=1
MVSANKYKEVSLLDILALALSIVGCINWGLVGIFQFDLVAWLFGAGAVLSRIIYTVIGLAGLWCISFFLRRARLGNSNE